MIMQNSYLRMANSTRTSQLNIVQGDKSPIAFQLLDRRQQPITSINGQIAEISIFEAKGMVLREFSKARVEDGVFTFHLEQVLNTGAHEMRVKVGDYYFPSDTGTFTFNILPAHDITTEIDPTNIQTIDLVIDALADEIVDYFYPVLEETTHEYFVQNAPVFKGEAFTYEDFTPEQLTELSMKVANESKDEDGNTIITFSDGTAVTVSKGDKGDKGDKGERGERGERGLTGDRGERGLTGLTGDKGEKGDALTFEELSPEQKEELRGEKGEKGEKGDKGDPLKFADLTPEQIEELQQEVDYSQVAAKEHTHELSEVNGLSTELDAKANSIDHEALKAQVDEIADTEGNINAGTIPMSHTDGVATEATVRDSINNLEDTFNQHTHTTADIDGLDDKLLELENNSGAPEKHNHDIADVNGLQSNLDNKADKEHSHGVEDVTGLREELDSKASTTDVDDIATELVSKAEVNHTHTTADIAGLDTKLSELENNTGGTLEEHTHEISEVNGLQDELADKADKEHTHTTADIDGLDTKLSELENNSGGIPAEHTHDMADIDGLQDALNSKADDSDLDNKADVAHTHSEYAKFQHTHNISLDGSANDEVKVRHYVDNKLTFTPLMRFLNEYSLADKADKDHTHNISDVTSLQTTLDGKASTDHNHDSKYATKNHGHWVNNGQQYDLRIKLDDDGANTIGNSKALIPYIREDVLGDKADVDHTHTASDITDLQATIDTAVANKAPTEHTHEMSNINGLITELDNLKSSGVDAKETISAAINSKGGTTTSTDTFDAMAQAIAGLSSGSGGDVEMVFINGNQSRTKAVEVKGVSFAPDEMFFIGTEGMSQGASASLYSMLNSLFAFDRKFVSYWFASKDPSVENKFERNTGITRTPTVRFNNDGIRVSDTNGLHSVTGLMILYKKDSFDAQAKAKKLYDNDHFRSPNWEYAVDVSLEQ